MNRETRISLGEKPNNGYTIDVSNLDIYGNLAKIFIEEGTPEEAKIYSDIIVYPIIQVKFNKDPINDTIIKIIYLFEFYIINLVGIFLFN